MSRARRPKGGPAAWKAAGHPLVKADGTPACDRSVGTAEFRTEVGIVGTGTRGAPALAFAAVAQNPNPLLPITSYKGVTRTLDDWATVFNIALIVASRSARGRRCSCPSSTGSSRTFGDSDVRTVVCVPSTKAITKRILGDAVEPVAHVVRPRPRALVTASDSSGCPRSCSCARTRTS